MHTNRFGNEIRRLRKRRGMPQQVVVEKIAQLARREGIEFSPSRKALSRYERGKAIETKIRQMMIDYLGASLGVPAGYLHTLYEADWTPSAPIAYPYDLVHDFAFNVERWIRDLDLIRDTILDGAANPGRQQLNNLEDDIQFLIKAPGQGVSSHIQSRAYDVLGWTILEHGEAATFCMTRKEAFACHQQIAARLSNLHNETGHPRFRDLSRLVNAFAYYAIGEYEKAFKRIRPRLDLGDLASPFWEMLALRIELLCATIGNRDDIAGEAQKALEQFVQDTPQDYSRFLALEALARDLAYRGARSAFAQLEKALALNPANPSLRLAAIRSQLEIMLCLKEWDAQEAARLWEIAKWIAGPNQWFTSQIGNDARVIIAKSHMPLDQYCPTSPARFSGLH